MKKEFIKMWGKARDNNGKNILDLLETSEQAVFCDLGCDDGTWTAKLAQKIRTKNIYGVEIIDERIQLAEQKGIIVKKGDINKEIPFADNYFDAVHANQVIEHLYDTASFIREIHRVLKPGGYAIISTENASSWHNIFALILGWQMFSLTNIDNKFSSIGNPLAVHRNKENAEPLKSWEHIRIFSYRGLREAFEINGFKTEKIMCSGYYPLPSFFANFDKRHGHFITIKFRKLI